MEKSNLTKKSLTCKLTTPELQQRKKTVIAKIKSVLLSKQETDDGYKYKFQGNDEAIDLLSQFIKTERLCCEFFSYQLSVSDGNSAIWFELSGPEGAKEFIKSELDF